MTVDIDNFFKYSLAIHTYFLLWCVCSSIFFFLSYLSFPCWIIGVYILWQQTFVRYTTVNIFYSVVYLFIFLVSVEEQFLVLIETNFFSFFFIIRAFSVLPNLCLPQGHKAILLLFLPEVLILGLWFMSN